MESRQPARASAMREPERERTLDDLWFRGFGFSRNAGVVVGFATCFNIVAGPVQI